MKTFDFPVNAISEVIDRAVELYKHDISDEEVQDFDDNFDFKMADILLCQNIFGERALDVEISYEGNGAITLNSELPKEELIELLKEGLDDRYAVDLGLDIIYDLL